jgi:anti-anti-sigma regulatory factor
MSDQQGSPREHASFVRTERSREEVELAVDGPLYDEFADEFQRQLDAMAAGHWPIVTLDFTKVKVIASKPTGKIVFLMKRLQETRRTLRIRGCDPGLYGQFKSIRFDRIIDIEP